MTPLIKHLCRKRNRHIKRGHEHDLQERIYLTISSARIKCNLFARRTENNMKLDGTQDHGKKRRQPECQFYLKPKRNQPVLQRHKYRSGIFHPFANSHTTWHSYPGSRGTHCRKVLSTAEAYSTWSRWVKLVREDVMRNSIKCFAEVEWQYRYKVCVPV